MDDNKAELIKRKPIEILEEWPDGEVLPSKVRIYIHKLRKKNIEELDAEEQNAIAFYEMRVEETSIKRVTTISGNRDGGMAQANILGMGIVTGAWRKLQEQTLSTVEEQGEYIAKLHKDRNDLADEVADAKKEVGAREQEIKQLKEELAKKESLLGKLSDAGIALGGVAVAGGIPALFGKLGLNYSSEIGTTINKILQLLSSEKKS